MTRLDGVFDLNGVGAYILLEHFLVLLHNYGVQQHKTHYDGRN